MDLGRSTAGGREDGVKTKLRNALEKDSHYFKSYFILFFFLVVAVTFGSGVNETFGEDGPGPAWPEGSFLHNHHA